jgi:hypothetical protein
VTLPETPPTVEAAARILSELAARPFDRTEKRAAAFGDVLTSLGSAAQAHPELSSALAGGGVGALAGGLGTAFGNAGRPEGRKRSVLGGALTGGLAGTAVGGGAALASRGLGHLRPPSPEGAKLPPGHFIDPETGQRMMVDPAAAGNQDLHAKIRQLTGMKSNPRQMIDAALGGAGALWDEAPIATTAAGVVGAGDLALHNPLFGFARRSAENVGGKVGRNLLSAGAKADKTLSDVLRDAITKNKPVGGTKPAVDPATGAVTKGEHITARGTSTGRKGVLDLLGGGRASPGSGTGNALEVTHTPMEEVKDRIDKPGGGFTEKPVKQPAGVKTDQMNFGELGQLKAMGHEGSKQYADRQLYQLPFTSKSYASRAKSLGGALALRGAAYGLPILGEYTARGLADDAHKEHELRSLMQQYAKPVPQQGG